ncbi:MAG: 3-deoxy-D-manno-octulosonic acid transferase [Alphaproteobacteria bacterium]
MMIRLYRCLTFLAGPLISLLLWRRKLAGREDPGRLSERKGIPGAPRPPGRLIWVHAASVGEALSALPLLHELLLRRHELNILMTTGTVSSARVLADQLPARVTHQFVPVDRGPWVRRFLDYWQPAMAVWIESDLWPNLVLETAGRGIPMALVNGRMSARSYQRWGYARDFIQRLLNSFSAVLAHDEQSAEFLRGLGASRAVCVGDLKQAAEPLAVDGAELARLQAIIGDRPVWIAASTHPGEEEIIHEVHQQLLVNFPRLLSVIAPRHADRGQQLAAQLAIDGLKVVRRATGEMPGPETDIYLGDTMGEMGLIYRLAKIAFVGGSLIPHGGQNPLEPARLGCAILHGPHTGNFMSIYADLDKAGAARETIGAPGLANAVAVLLGDQKTAVSRGLAAKAVAVKGIDKVLVHIMAAIEPLLPDPE